MKTWRGQSGEPESPASTPYLPRAVPRPLRCWNLNTLQERSLLCSPFSICPPSCSFSAILCPDMGPRKADPCGVHCPCSSATWTGFGLKGPGTIPDALYELIHTKSITIRYYPDFTNKAKEAERSSDLLKATQPNGWRSQDLKKGIWLQSLCP